MLTKPSGWDEAKEVTGGPAERPPAGGHVLGVVKVECKPSSRGEDMIVLYLDIARGKFKNYYRDLSAKMNTDCYIRYYQLTQSEKSIPFFKGMVTSFQKSNPGYTWNWEPQSLARKMVGANLREKEYVNAQGEKRMGLKIGFLTSIESVDKGLQVMPPKMLDGGNNGNNGGYGFGESAPLTPPPEDDLPF